MREETGEDGVYIYIYAPSRMGGMQAAWMGVGCRMAMAPRESTSQRSIPRAGKSRAGAGGKAGESAGTEGVAAIAAAVWMGERRK